MPVQDTPGPDDLGRLPLLPNPFTDEYVRDQVEFYGLESYDKDGVVIRQETCHGSMDDYLNKWFHVGDYSVPVFYIDGRLWMSLSRMEVQSQAVPIAMAEGKVILLGLGMGFVCLKIMQSNLVEEVLVYEQEPRVIAFFKENFSRRYGFHKVKFIEGDAREEFQSEWCDVCYADIYPELFGKHIEDDPELFCTRNSIDQYVYWGFERIIWEALEQRLVVLESVPLLLRWFFSSWMKTPANPDVPGCMLNNLPFDEDRTLKASFVRQMLEGIKMTGLCFSWR